MKFSALALIFSLLVTGRGFAGDASCEFPILDEPSQVSESTCKELSSDAYQKKILDYICSSSCNDIQICLGNFQKLKADPQISTTIARVEKSTSVYAKDRKLEKCGNYEPQAPIDADDQTTWDAFKEFVEARRSMNHLLKAKLVTVKNQCIRRDTTSGAYMRFKRTSRYSELLTQCRKLEHVPDRQTGSTP